MLWVIALGAAAQLPVDHVMIDHVPARPWIQTTTANGGAVTVAVPNVAVQVAAAASQSAQPTFDPMNFLSKCNAVVLCNRHIYACAEAPLECFVGGVASTWDCPGAASSSCWAIVNGTAQTVLPVATAHAVEFRNGTAVVYNAPGSVMAAEHLALAFGMLAIAIAVQYNAVSQPLLINWAVAISSVLITTTTSARLGVYHHAAAVVAATFTATRLLFHLGPVDGSIRSLSLVAALSVVPTELLGLTPLMYASFVVSMCIAAAAQSYHAVTFLCLVFWAAAAIDTTVAAAFLYTPESINELVLGAAITASCAAAGILGK